MRSVSKGNPSYTRETSESLTRPGLRTYLGVHEYFVLDDLMGTVGVGWLMG
jgi:hypothetical protein